MLLWIGLAAIVVGLLLAVFGGKRNTFGSFRGNYAQDAGRDVQQSYAETASAKPPEAPVRNEDRFIKWTGPLIAFGGLILTAIKVLAGSS